LQRLGVSFDFVEVEIIEEGGFEMNRVQVAGGFQARDQSFELF
jgi:hypothetical protein